MCGSSRHGEKNEEGEKQIPHCTHFGNFLLTVYFMYCNVDSASVDAPICHVFIYITESNTTLRIPKGDLNRCNIF